MPGVKARLLALLSGVLLGTVSESSLAPVLPFLARAFGVGPEAAQGVASAGLLGAALAYLPLAWFGGRVGAARLFRLGLLLHSLLALLLFSASSLGQVYALRFLQGVATAMVVGLVPGLATSSFPQARGYAMGMVAGTVAAGTLLGPALGGMAASLEARYVFLLPLPFALLALALARHLPGLPPQRADLRALLRAPGFMAALLATALYFLHTLGTTVVLAFFLSEEGVSPAAIGGLLLLGPLQLLLLGPWAGRAADRLGYTPVALRGAYLLVGAGVAFALLPLLHPLWGAGLGLVLLGTGRALFQAANNAQVLSLAPKGLEGLASGALSVARTLGQALGSALGGLVYAVLDRPYGHAPAFALTVLLFSLLMASSAWLVQGRGEGA